MIEQKRKRRLVGFSTFFGLDFDEERLIKQEPIGGNSASENRRIGGATCSPE